VNFDNNSTYELQPIRVNDSLLSQLQRLPNVKQVSTFISKPGILKTDSAFHGIVFKATDSLSSFSENLVEGAMPSQPNEVVVSSVLARQLALSLGDQILCYFIEDDLRVRRLLISGLYYTCMTEMDRVFVWGQQQLLRQLNRWDDNQVSVIEILLDDLRWLEQSTNEVYFLTANRLDEEGKAFYTQNLKQLNPAIFSWLDLLDMNVVIIIILMLCVSGFSIITGLIILILDSVTLVGTLKALGASDAFVRRVFVYQALMLIGKGVLVGNLLGVCLCAVQYFTHVIPLEAATYYVSYVPMAFPWGLWLALNLGTILISWLILLAPSAIVTQISPAKVMHFE
jgi:lipoprotein-releasing system permease protein